MHCEMLFVKRASYLSFTDILFAGLQSCVSLKILVLDHNKIQIITEEDFHIGNKLKTLLLENNRIKFLCFTKGLSNIEKLFISYNKIAVRK